MRAGAATVNKVLGVPPLVGVAMGGGTERGVAVLVESSLEARQ